MNAKSSRWCGQVLMGSLPPTQLREALMSLTRRAHGRTVRFLVATLFAVIANARAADAQWVICGAADFTGDGKVELFFRRSTGENSIYEMDGAKILSTGGIVTAATSPDWIIQAFGDFNGDKKKDILWRRPSGELGIWLMDSRTAKAEPMAPEFQALKDDWQIGGVGDFDGDHKDDILWRRRTGENSIWFMDGFKCRSGSVIPPLPLDWRVDAVADFNGDGCSDIFWRRADGAFGIWFVNNTTVTAPPTDHSADLKHDWQLLAAADMDNDGKADLIWQRKESSEVGVWFMNGTHVEAQVPLMAKRDTVIEAVGDFNGDGRKDFLYRDMRTNEYLVAMSDSNCEDLRFKGGIACSLVLVGFGKLLLVPPNLVAWGVAMYGGYQCFVNQAAYASCGGYHYETFHAYGGPILSPGGRAGTSERPGISPSERFAGGNGGGSGSGGGNGGGRDYKGFTFTKDTKNGGWITRDNETGREYHEPPAPKR